MPLTFRDKDEVHPVVFMTGPESLARHESYHIWFVSTIPVVTWYRNHLIHKDTRLYPVRIVL